MDKTIRNIFQEGVNVDCSPLMQPDNSIRGSVNGTLMDIGNGLFQWVPLKGNTSILTFPETYTPLNYFSFPDELIVWLYSATKASIIMSITFDSSWAATSQVIYINPQLILTPENPLRVFGYSENENIKRVYFSDRTGEPYVLNLKEVATTIILTANANNLTVGNWYTVMTGAVDQKDWEGNVEQTYNPGDSFYYYGGFTDYDGRDYVASGTVRTFVPLERLKWQPNATPLKMEYNGKVAGSLLYGNYRIAYRYGTTSGFLSPVINIDTFTVIKEGVSANDFDKYQDNQGDSHLKNSAYGLSFILTEYDPTFDFVEMIAMHAIAQDTFENGTVFNTYDLPKDNSPIDIAFTDYSGSGTITMNEMLLNPIPISAIRDMTVIKKHAAITNFKERKELKLKQKLSATIKQEIYEMLTDITGTPDYTSSFKALSASAKGGETSQLYKNQWYKTVSGLTANGVSYGAGILFKCALTETLGAGTAMPVFARKSHYNWTAAKQEYSVIPLRQWLDYKDPILASQAAGFWGDVDERLGILFYDKKMIPYFGRYLGEIHTSARNAANSDYTGKVLSLLKIDGPNVSINTLSLVLDGIDLTDVINDIGGFCICRVPVKTPIISEGFLEAIKYTDNDTDDYHERFPFLSNPASAGPSNNYLRRSNWYFYVSPEFLFNNKANSEILQNDNFRIERYQAGARVTNWNVVTANPYPGMYTHTRPHQSGYEGTFYNYGHLYQKAYAEVNPVGAVTIGETNPIAKYRNIEIDKKTEIRFDDDQPGYFFKNIASRNEDVSFKPVGGKGILVKTDRKEDGSDLSAAIGFGSFDNPVTCGITVVQQRRSASTTGNSKFDIEKLELVQISPIQIITTNYKTQIFNGTKYIVTGLQVFGGGCYVNIFDHVRVMQDVFERNKTQLSVEGRAEKSLSHSDSIFIPLQSHFNIALRKGKHIGNVRSFDNITDELNNYYEVNPGGISYNSDLSGETGMPGMWEEFLYDDSYNNLGDAVRYPMLPANYIDQESFSNRVRYSTQKTAGESTDSFRRFLINNYIDLDSQFGPVSNIDGSSGRLFYWQQNAVGYIPVGERELVPSSMGAPIQLGIGGMMERNDDLDTFHGNQHTFGLLRVANGFLWHDYLRNDMLYLSFGGALKNISSENSFSSWMRDRHPDIQNNDNPFIETGGISCGFDPEMKLAFFSYLKAISDEWVTIAIHTETLKLMGTYTSYPELYITHNNAKLLTPSHTMNDDTHQETIVHPTVQNVIFGGLYDFPVIDYYGGFAAEGYEVPTMAHYDTLIAYAGASAGGKLKSTSSGFWDAPNTGATNIYNFNFKAAGYLADIYNHWNLRSQGRAWTRTELDGSYAGTFVCNYNNASALTNYTAKSCGCSVILKKITPTAEDLAKADGSYCDDYVGNNGWVYKTVKIGTQVWVAEPSVETLYTNGDPIPTPYASVPWGSMGWVDNLQDHSYIYTAGYTEVLTVPDIPIETKLAFTSLYLHNSNNIGLFYDKYNDSYIDVVITANDKNIKFDVSQFICRSKFFDSIEYMYQYVGGGQNPFAKSIIEQTTNPYNYRRFGDKWTARLPITPYGRITGIAMMLRCMLSPTGTNQRDLALQEIQTLVRDYQL